MTDRAFKSARVGVIKMKGYCDLCGKEIDETEVTYIINKVACEDCKASLKKDKDSLIKRVARVGVFLFGVVVIIIVVVAGRV